MPSEASPPVPLSVTGEGERGEASQGIPLHRLQPNWAGTSHSAYIPITRSIACAQTAQNDFGLRLNMMQSTSGR